MPKLPDIEDFINYNKNVGPLQLLEVGYPGTGKSSHATQLLIKCFERKKETAIMHGDLTCEWRHFLRYSKYIKKIKVLIPKLKDKIHAVNVYNLPEKYPKVELLFFEDLDFSKLNVIKYLEDKSIVVIYDDCFTAESKTLLWKDIAHKLISRRIKLDYTITYLCHEAGNYYPQTARKEQWEAVDDFVSYFVYFRKMNIRAILLTQLETEVYDRLRKKCIWKVYRICYPSDRGHARLIKKYIKKMSIENYNLFYGDLYSPLNKNKPTREIRVRSMMIPRILVNLNEPPEKANKQTKKDALINKMIRSLYEKDYSIAKIAEMCSISRETIHRRLKNTENQVNRRGKGVR